MRNSHFFYIDRRMNPSYIRLENLINASHFIMLYGPRSNGKTSLVKELMSEIQYDSY